MKKSVTATVLACALVVGGVGLTPAGASESGADICYSVSIDTLLSFQKVRAGA